MKVSVVLVLAVAMLARAAVGSAPVLAGDMFKQSVELELDGQASESNGAQSGQPSRDLLTTISHWLSTEFSLSIDTLPRIKFVLPERLGLLRLRGVSADHPGDGRDVVAVYDDGAQAVYLRQDWTGQTPAETSILVHEMVHHAQNLTGAKFECPQAREKLAYEAQERWLTQFGSNLEKEFEIDGFTLLVRTSCGI
jgi:Domain of unknown function (DUF6647)